MDATRPVSPPPEWVELGRISRFEARSGVFSVDLYGDDPANLLAAEQVSFVHPSRGGHLGYWQRGTPRFWPAAAVHDFLKRGHSTLSFNSYSGPARVKKN